MKPTADDRFNLELLKLLVQVAWQDEALANGEANMIQGLGRSWSVAEPELQDLLRHMRERRLPAPDLGLLRTRPDEVLEAVRAVTAVDGHLADTEVALVEQVQAMLAEGSEAKP